MEEKKYFTAEEARQVSDEVNSESMKRELDWIYNLINNAINYTGDDKKVYINILKGKDLTIEITDTGKGIDKDEIDLIWDKYYKSKKNHQRNTVGTGLGLLGGNGGLLGNLFGGGWNCHCLQMSASLKYALPKLFHMIWYDYTG